MKVKPFLQRLIGNEQEFSLTDRIFHCMCLIAFAALLYNLVFNYVIALPQVADMCWATIIVLSGIYYISRIRRRTNLGRIIFSSVAMLLLSVNYFINSGIDGPVDISFVFIFVMIIAIVPIRQYPFWVALNLVVVAALHLFQFKHGALVPYTYKDVASRYVDILSAYLTALVIVVFSFYTIRRSYELERNSALEKAAQMKLLNEERNKLFSIIAHDLRSPLSNIQNYLELLAEVELEEEERFAIKKELLQATRSTLEMLNNVLIWSQDQMKGMKSTLAPVNLRDVLVPQLSLFTNIAANKSITVETEIDSELVVIANRDMLQIIVRNLVNNAIKFTALGGNIKVGAVQKNNKCLITVKDSGTGKPVQLQPDVFSLSGQSTQGTANEKGVGLGLVLCKEYTEAHHGKIWFEAGELSGVTFFVEIPLLTGRSQIAG